MIKNNYKSFSLAESPPSSPSSLRSQRFHRWSPMRSSRYANLLHRIVIVGTKWLESALVEILFSCCCRWFFPITSPAVHELVRKVTMAEHTATMRYLMKAFIFGFIRFSCPLLTSPHSFLERRKRRTRIRAWSRG